MIKSTSLLMFHCSQAFHSKCARALGIDNLKNDPRIRADTHDSYNYKMLSKWRAIPNAEEKPEKDIGTHLVKRLMRLNV